MSDLNLENIVGFKAVDKDGNEQNVTVDEMVDMVSTRMVMALSEIFFEGFYGNVVQGLVIKQLEDAVFIFGIAIDGTLIFRKGIIQTFQLGKILR